MASVILYEEMISRTGREVGGLRVTLPVDESESGRSQGAVDGQQDHLRSTIPHSTELAPGRHEFIATGRGFAQAAEQIDVAHADLIVAISPDYTVSVAPKHPGSLRIHPVEGPDELQPYRFYKGQPTSYFRQSVGLTLWVSMVLSFACFLAGSLFSTGRFRLHCPSWRVGIILTLLCSLPVLLLTRAGLGGLVTGHRHEAACKLAGTSDFISGGSPEVPNCSTVPAVGGTVVMR